MRYCLLFTLSLGLVLPRALEAQWVERTQTGASRRPAVREGVDLNTALAQQRVGRQERSCERSLVINLIAGAAGGALTPIILTPLYSLIRSGYHGILPPVNTKPAIPYAAVAGTVYGIRETIRCRRQTAGRR